MLCDKQRPRSRRTDAGESDDPIDHDTVAMSGSSAKLTSKASMARNDATRLQRCPHCGSESVYRWGKSDVGVPRGRCRACERTFSPRTGTWIAGVREAQKFAYVLEDMMMKEPGSCRRLAEVLEVDKMTVWHWRRRISQALLGSHPPAVSAPVEIHDEPIRESRKGSREWVDHLGDPARHPAPNRPRWVDVDRHALPLPHALAAYQLEVLISAAEGGYQPLVAPLVCPSAARYLCDACGTVQLQGRAGACRRATVGLDAGHTEDWPVESAMVWQDSTWFPEAHEVLVIDRSVPTPCAAIWHTEPAAGDRVERAAPATSRFGTDNGVLRTLKMPTIDCLAAAFRAFLRPFAGPAAKYLDAYTAWFIKRLEGSDEGRLDRAWLLLLT